MGADFSSYLSPFSWRYGSKAMREIWSEENKARTWRRIWVALAETEAQFGLVNEDQLADLKAHQDDIDLKRTAEFEAKFHHDVMAEIHTYQEQAPIGGIILHLGATSSDIKDNAVVLQCKDALAIVIEQAKVVLGCLAEKMLAWAGKPIIAFTHLQPAEPTTLGYRMALYAQDILMDYESLLQLSHSLRGKGIRGAVGTGASFAEIIGADNVDQFDSLLSNQLNLPFFDIVSQTYPRKQDLLILNALSSLGASLHKFAFDLRLMQSPVIGEWSEPFGSSQIGSSAMPFKRNPINAEKMNSLARLLAQYPAVAWGNAANALFERTLDDSANSRIILPEAFLICDELLKTTTSILNGMGLWEEQMDFNFHTYAPFAAVETILMAACQRGADRQEMHECLRRLSLLAWEKVMHHEPNDLLSMIREDATIREYLSTEDLDQLPPIEAYIGFAESRTRKLAEDIVQRLSR